MHTRVEKIATGQLHMRLPDASSSPDSLSDGAWRAQQFLSKHQNDEDEPSAAYCPARGALSPACWRYWCLGWRDWPGAPPICREYTTDFLQEKGESRYSRILEMSANRGMITDRHGEPLAISTPVESVWSSPQDMRRHTRADEKIGKIGRSGCAEIRQRVNATPRATGGTTSGGAQHSSNMGRSATLYTSSGTCHLILRPRWSNLICRVCF